MPFSSSSGKPFIQKVFEKTLKYCPEVYNMNEVSIVDFGAGSGTYSDLYKKLFKTENLSMTAVEIFEPYIEKYDLNSKYDKVYLGSAKSYLDSMEHLGGCAIFGDVIEHMSKEDAIEVFNKALQNFNFVIMSIPLGHYPQDEYDGNPYEKHITDNWSHEEVLKTFNGIFLSEVDKEIGVYVASDKIVSHAINDVLINPKIGVYIICKNEENFIERCLNSVKYADEIVILDTGSTDNTKMLIKFLIDQSVLFSSNTKLVSSAILPWRFDEAKNMALSFLSKDIDIAVSLDADEFMEDGWKIKLLEGIKANPTATRFNHRFETVWNWDKPEELPSVSSHWHDRIHVRSGYMWNLPVHEILQYKVGTEQIAWIPEVKMIQHPDTSKSRSSYLPLLEKSVKENPTIWKSWSFLATEYFNINKTEEGLKCLVSAFNIDNPTNQPDKSFIACSIASKLAEINMIAEAKNWWNICMQFSNIREYYVYAAKFYESIKDYETAKLLAIQSSEMKEKSSGYDYNEKCWNEEYDNWVNYYKSNGKT